MTDGSSANWANVLRKATGEQMTTYNGIVVTRGFKAYMAHTNNDSGSPSRPTSRTENEARLDKEDHIAKSFPMALRISSPSGPVESPPLEVVESEPFPFFDLSFDLRQAVLMQVFPSSTLSVFLRRNVHNSSAGIAFPPIVRATKRLRAEGLYAALQQTELEIRSGPGNAAFNAWLATIDLSSLHGDINTTTRTGFDAVHKLSFPFFSRFPHWHLPRTALNDDVELMKKCTQLQQVTLKLQPVDLIDNMEEDLLKTPIQLVGTFRMRGVLTLENLEKLILVGKVMKWYADWEIDGITGLKKWLDVEYKKLGRKVVVTIIDE